MSSLRAYDTSLGLFESFKGVSLNAVRGERAFLRHEGAVLLGMVLSLGLESLK